MQLRFMQRPCLKTDLLNRGVIMKPFEIFLSYKQTDEFGNITEDYRRAESLYQLLTKAGFRVFFSEKSIFEIGISDYKKGIDAALAQAQVLVVIALKEDYLNSGWVEYEYETFCEDILSGRKPLGKIISYTDARCSLALPRTLTRFQNYTFDRFPPEKIVEFLVNAFQKKETAAPAGILQNTEYSSKDSLSTSDQPHKSIYSSDYSNEFRRLEIQARNSAVSDKTALDYVFSLPQLQEKSEVYVLDAGSAYGYVSADRFSPRPNVQKILCLDFNPRVVERARIRFADNPKMIFEVLDLESEDMEQQLKLLLRKHDIPEIDIVYSALTLHHLKNPNRVLRKFRKVMSNGSVIMLRGSDDGSKLCYPKGDLMESIIQKTMEAKGVSDRFNGRKIFTQLTDAGFRDVKMFSYMRDLSQLSYDSIEDLFQESFAYRKNYFKRAVEEDPDDLEARRNLEWMEWALEEFEDQFFQKSFWYCEYDYVGIAQK